MIRAGGPTSDFSSTHSGEEIGLFSFRSFTSGNQRSSDLSAVVQEIVDREGWVSGNAMAFMIMGSGKRVADSREGGSDKAAVLHIEYSQPAEIEVP